ncbi:MAG: hypothetical protein ACI8YI_002749, partial [Paracoccaceae bacterium]
VIVVSCENLSHCNEIQNGFSENFSAHMLNISFGYIACCLRRE